MSLPTRQRQRSPRVKIPAYLAWVRTLPCLVTGRTDGVEAAHIRYGDRRYGKIHAGLGEKPSDFWVVPLHYEKHRTGKGAQHTMNEHEFWKIERIDPCQVALALYVTYLHGADVEVAESILHEARINGVPF